MNGPQVRGRAGEDVAAEFLETKGYRILARNFRCRVGEIDLVAAEGGTLCFVEVKLRKDASFAAAREFVTAAKQQKLRRAAEFYLASRGTPYGASRSRSHGAYSGTAGVSPDFDEQKIRFDVVEVYAPYGEEGHKYVRLIRDAFE